MHKRVKGLLESAALDPEELPPPKSFWFDEDALKAWFKERRELQKEKWKSENV